MTKNKLMNYFLNLLFKCNGQFKPTATNLYAVGKSGPPTTATVTLHIDAKEPLTRPLLDHLVPNIKLDVIIAFKINLKTRTYKTCCLDNSQSGRVKLFNLKNNNLTYRSIRFDDCAFTNILDKSNTIQNVNIKKTIGNMECDTVKLESNVTIEQFDSGKFNSCVNSNTVTTDKYLIQRGTNRGHSITVVLNCPYYSYANASEILITGINILRDKTSYVSIQKRFKVINDCYTNFLNCYKTLGSYTVTQIKSLKEFNNVTVTSRYTC